MPNQLTESSGLAPDVNEKNIHSTMAERAVLGGLLRKDNTLDVLAVLLTEEDFYLHAHRLIFRQILITRKAAKRPVLVAVAEALELAGELSKIGGIGYLHSLLEGLPADEDIQQCAVILRERLVTRSLPTQVDEDLRAWAELLCKHSRERTRKQLLKLACDEISIGVMNATGGTAAQLIDAAIAKLLLLKDSYIELPDK